MAGDIARWRAPEGAMRRLAGALVYLALALVLLLPVALASPALAQKAAEGALLRTFKGHSGTVTSVAFSPDGRTALSGSADGTLQLWDMSTGHRVRTFEGHSGLVWSVAFSPHGRTVLSGSSDMTLKLWDVATGSLLRTFKGHSDSLWESNRPNWVTSVAFSPDGRTVVSGGEGIKLWDVSTGRVLRSFKEHSSSVLSVAFSPDGRTVLSGDYDNMLKLWDVSTGRILRTFKGHSDWVKSVAFAPNGRTALSGSNDRTLKLWDVSTGRVLRTFTGHSEVVASVAFSPDGRTALSGGGTDKTLKWWDVATGRELRTFRGHPDVVSSVAVSPDGRTALSGSWDNTLKLWDLGLPAAETPTMAVAPPPAPPAAPSAPASPPPAAPSIPAALPPPALPVIAPSIQTAQAPVPPRPAAAAPAETRVALVIGNSSYRGMPRLVNPGRDAKAVANSLRGVGFTQVVEAANLSREGMLAALNDFASKAEGADWAMVYYAGHGMEMHGTNYLIPVDARLASDVAVADEAISLNRVLSSLAHTRKLRLVVLDACRDNPFAPRIAAATRSTPTRGLAPVEPEGSTLVVYAAKHGQVAQDGDGANSPFVTALVKHMPTQQLDVGIMFRRVARDVMEATGRKQEPFTYGSLIEEGFFFSVKPAQ